MKFMSMFVKSIEGIDLLPYKYRKIFFEKIKLSGPYQISRGYRTSETDRSGIDSSMLLGSCRYFKINNFKWNLWAVGSKLLALILIYYMAMVVTDKYKTTFTSPLLYRFVLNGLLYIFQSLFIIITFFFF